MKVTLLTLGTNTEDGQCPEVIQLFFRGHGLDLHLPSIMQALSDGEELEREGCYTLELELAAMPAGHTLWADVHDFLLGE